MFEKWEIPDNICELSPINSKNLDLFVGHEKETTRLKDILANKSVVVLEGEIGVGKTSMGNFLRHSKDGYFTPLDEIPCKKHWNNDRFLENVLAAITEEVMRKNSRYAKFRKEKIIKKVHELFADKTLFSFGVSAFTAGVQGGKSVSKAPVLNQTVLLGYLQEIGQLLSDKLGKQAPIIIQLNNFDLQYGFEEKDIENFFNEVRDTLQLPFCSWIICGKTGLEAFLRNKVPRVHQIINHTTKVQPLKQQEITRAFKLRIKKADQKGKLPLDRDLMKIIYDMSAGSFRNILNTVSKLLLEFYNDPLVDEITTAHAEGVFYPEAHRDLETLERSKTKYPVFKAIVLEPGLNQTKLVKRLNMRQSNVSKYVLDLAKEGFIHVIRESRDAYYYPEPKYYIGLNWLFTEEKNNHTSGVGDQ